MNNFQNGVYRGQRLNMSVRGNVEFYGEYSIQVVEPAKDGTPRIRVNGGRAHKVFGHSNGILRGLKGITSVTASAMDYAPGYDDLRRFPVDDVTISADPQFLVRAL